MKMIVETALACCYLAGLCFTLAALEGGALLLDKLAARRRRAKRNAPRTLACSKAQATITHKIIA